MRYTITIPTKDRHGMTLLSAKRQEILEEVVRLLITETGGVTTFEGDGHWVNEIGRLISEPVTKVETYTHREYFRVKLLEIAEKVKTELNQESVFITSGGKGEIV